MDWTLLVARILHVMLGIFWAGTLVFNALFLLPSIRDAGPDGAKVSEGIMRRGFMKILPIVATFTLISGVWLYWRVSVGFSPAYMRSGPGMAYGIGAVTALTAFGIGMGIVNPSMREAMRLTGLASATRDDQTESRMAEAQRLRLRAFKAARLVALLLTLTGLTMAIGRYT